MASGLHFRECDRLTSSPEVFDTAAPPRRPYVRSNLLFDKLTEDEVALIGGKGANLGKMRALGFRFRRGSS